MNSKMLVNIVPHNSGKLITDAAKNAGASGGTILMGRGTAENSVIQLLGLGDKTKDIALVIANSDIYDEVRQKIIESAEEKKSHFGVSFAINIGNFIKSGSIQNENEQNNEKTEGVNKMNDKKTSYKMINVIVNKGFAEDAMAAARKAGAGGGTIIGAKGTAKEGDETFFGIEIVPEKEMLMMLVPEEKEKEITDAVKNLPCFSKAGSGIIFTADAVDFTLLGK